MYIKCSNEKQNFLTWYENDFFHIKEVTGATKFQPCEPEYKNTSNRDSYIKQAEELEEVANRILKTYNGAI